MFQITQYESGKEPRVNKIIPVDEVLNLIRNGDENLNLILLARSMGKGDKKYDTIKKKLLPSFRFNFLFDSTASNANITSPTGLLYLDADQVDEVPQSPYVYASWKSLSNTGFSVLVKVENLSRFNFSDAYNHLSEQIGIISDRYARKATQQTIQSYDPNLYHNPDSLVYSCPIGKVSRPVIFEKKEECIGTYETLYKDGDSIRFNNINDYFTGEFEEQQYRLFTDKIRICRPFIPLRIEEGNRNSTMFFHMSQYSLLNPQAGKNWLKSVAESINKKMYPRMSDKEINSVIDSVLKKRADGSLEMHFNQERRILFNPKMTTPVNEKMKIVNAVLGKMKSDFTKDLIYLTLENWDFQANGIITQKKTAVQAGRSIQTVKRYWGEFKDYVLTLNTDNQK
ncbi:BT4734/BF3469 family protein [Flavobacterium sp.]|uniref:BT4734/BF3469 family protein n=1 Tax=Flavobacterium sp. TaxID=239 RepID=UPI002601A851|nr:BT4734/BF3469 family protein [Flavobacterium sp.]